MTKIESVDGYFSFRESRKKQVKQKRTERATSFDSVLEASASSEEQLGPVTVSSEEGWDLEALIDGVHSAGERLKEKPSIVSIKAYRDAVRRFLKYALDRMIDVQEQISGINVLKRKRFTIIKVIDQKLESLVSAVLQGQESQMSILDRVEEINGLVVDVVS